MKLNANKFHVNYPSFVRLSYDFFNAAFFPCRHTVKQIAEIISNRFIRWMEFDKNVLKYSAGKRILVQTNTIGIGGGGDSVFLPNHMQVKENYAFNIYDDNDFFHSFFHQLWLIFFWRKRFIPLRPCFYSLIISHGNGNEQKSEENPKRKN